MPSSLVSSCRCLLAAAAAAVVVSGCAQLPDGEGQANSTAGEAALPAALPTQAPEAPMAPASTATVSSSKQVAGDGQALSSGAAMESGRMSDDRRGLGLVPPVAGPMSSIDGISRPWEVPEIPRNLQQDPYRPSDQQGLASWYGGQFHGRKTANGERFDKGGLTAAHKTLPFGTQLCVRSMVTGKAVVVRVNDRGPYAGDRILDLSQGAAAELGMLGLGIKPVEYWTLDEDEDDCPSFVLAGRRGAGRLTEAAAHKAGQSAQHGGRVHQTLSGTSAGQRGVVSKQAAKQRKTVNTKAVSAKAAAQRRKK